MGNRLREKSFGASYGSFETGTPAYFSTAKRFEFSNFVMIGRS